MEAALQAQEKRKEKTRRKIMDNASRLFYKRGFKDVSIKELCKVIGISKVTFYKYYSDKEDLVKTIFEESLSENMPAVLENFKSKKPVEQIIETHYDLMAAYFVSKVSTRMMDDMESQMPELYERLSKLRQRNVDTLKKLFERGQKEGSLRKDFDPEAMGVMYEIIMGSVFRPSFLKSKGLTLEQTASVIKASLLHGIVEPNRKNYRA